MVEIDPFFFVAFGGTILFLVVLVFWVLRKPLLATIPAAPHAVRRDLAYRIRASGYPVELTKDVLRVRIDSLAAIKLHVRETWEGDSEIRYEVDATPAGWAFVLIFALVGYLGIVALVVASLIHFRARRFARSRVAPLLAAPPPIGTLPLPDVRSLLIEGLSEAQRLSSEALEYEKEARQNAVALLILGAIALWALVFVALSVFVPLSPNPMLTAFYVASALSAVGMTVGFLLVHERGSDRVAELERDAAFYRSVWMGEVIAAAPSPQGPRGGLELLLRAALRTPYWRELRRRHRFWHDPVAGLMMFMLAYAATLFTALAIFAEPLPMEWRLFLGTFGAFLGAGSIWFVRSWSREVRGQDERDRRDWEKRREAIEAELWRILSG